MLAQHLITKPVFDALFKDYSFASHNPVSVAMQQVLDVLHEHRLEKEADTLEKFYASVAMRAEGIDSAEGKQKIVVELYDKFFRNAFPKMTERLGIVYTPVEVVDFIIHSINDLLQQEFGQTLGSKGVHIIDPFTGTGTFITRLLQSGLIKPSELPHKYKHEIHANEIVLLAYYIAAINIEAVYHSLVSKHATGAYPSESKIQNQQSKIDNPSSTTLGRPVGAQSSDDTEPRAMPWAGMDQALGLQDARNQSANAISSAPTGQTTIAQGNALGMGAKKNSSPEGAHYEPFQGICLTDTFQLYEKGDLISNLLTNNSDRRKRQKALDIRVIMGNPPYSKGQDSADDNNENVVYPELDQRIRSTYAARSKIKMVRALYDSYIRGIRWASDRIGNSGIVGFVTNGGFLDSNSADGLRQCLTEEFSSVYVFHLRGNARTSGEQRRKEKDNVFGQGSRAPIAISLLVKNPNAKLHGGIYFHDIGDYLTIEEKLKKISSFASVGGIFAANGWQTITPDAHGDWLNLRDAGFEKFMVMGNKKDPAATSIFSTYSCGVKSNRDVWVYNYSRKNLASNVRTCINFFNKELERFAEAKSEKSTLPIDDFIRIDPTQISWADDFKKYLSNGTRLEFDDFSPTHAIYRPYNKQWLYGAKQLNWSRYKMPIIFPDSEVTNRLIMIKQRWSGEGQLALIVDRLWIYNRMAALNASPSTSTNSLTMSPPTPTTSSLPHQKASPASTPAATPSPTPDSPISSKPIRRRAKAARSPRKISSTTFTACCIPRTTAAATPTTSARNSRASPP
jgi:predicted helicase